MKGLINMKNINTYFALALSAAAISLAVGMTANPASAQTIPVSGAFTFNSIGASGSGVSGPGYTPYFFNIALTNPTTDTFTITSVTFNAANTTAVNFTNSGDLIGNYNLATPFQLGTGTTNQLSAFELDLSGNVPANVTLTGNLDFEGTNMTTNQSLTVANPAFSYTTPAVVPSAVPEPSPLTLFAAGGLVMGSLLIRAKRRLQA